MTITDSDEIFVAGETKIYKLSANLSELINVNISNNVVRVRGLSLTNGGQYIVACLNTGSCFGYDVINLNRTMSSVPLNQPDRDMIASENPVAMFPGQAEGFVYTGTSTNTNDQRTRRMSLGQHEISGGSIMANTTRDYNQIVTSEFNRRVFRAGFIVDNFTYYIVEDDASRIRILRVCNEYTDGTFQGLYEVQLICVREEALFAGASLFRNILNSTNTLVLTVRSPDIVPFRSGRVCTYSISEINTAMKNGRVACVGGEDRETVWDNNFPASNFYMSICSSATVSHLFIQIMYCAICF